MLAAAVVVGLVANVIVGRWLLLRGRGTPVPANGLSVAALLLTGAASLYWAPTVLSESDVTFAWLWLLLPVAVAGVAVIPRRSVRWGAAIVLLPLILLGAASVGLAYLPASLLMFLSAGATPAGDPSDPERIEHLGERRHVAGRRPST